MTTFRVTDTMSVNYLYVNYDITKSTVLKEKTPTELPTVPELTILSTKLCYSVILLNSKFL